MKGGESGKKRDEVDERELKQREVQVGVMMAKVQMAMVSEVDHTRSKLWFRRCSSCRNKTS